MAGPTVPVPREIVGVARKAKGRPDEIEELLQVYISMTQNPADDIYMLVRSTSESAADEHGEDSSSPIAETVDPSAVGRNAGIHRPHSRDVAGTARRRC